MRHLVFYSSQSGHRGNIDCNFIHFPPWLEDIRSLEEDISERFCNGAKVAVEGWERIQDENDLNMISLQDIIQLTIKNTTLQPECKVKVNDSIYTIHFGQYQYQNHQHIGWYMTCDTQNDVIELVTELVYHEFDII